MASPVSLNGKSHGQKPSSAAFFILSRLCSSLQILRMPNGTEEFSFCDSWDPFIACFLCPPWQRRFADHPRCSLIFV
ncbi:hypothetical protein RHGRI_029552 [Rhododendron griersonianum]|uniref:Uncharacterized protein n=1 Tax=Rhododendron griersonianum TaxID=479676 RepID=A0AAV6IQB6_9ERIC|nr:hypothetical protein RHGRI_029552 [Rhododendron griersonianum]